MGRVCRLAGLACVFTGSATADGDAGAAEVLWVRPSPRLQGAAIRQFLDWAGWDFFAVLFAGDGDPIKYREALLLSNAHIIFRKVTPSYHSETFQLLHSLKDAGVVNFVLDMTVDQLSKTLQLASAANLSSKEHSYLCIIDWIDPLVYRQQLSAYAFGGANLTALQLDRFGSSQLPASMPIEDRLQIEVDQALALAYKAVKSPAGTERGASIAPLRPGLRGLGGSACNVTRRATGAFLRAAKTMLARNFGLVQPGEEEEKAYYNFSYSALHMHTDGMNKFAGWTADRGFYLTTDTDGASANSSEVSDIQNHATSSFAFGSAAARYSANLSVVSVEDPPFNIYREYDELGRRLHGNDQWTGLAIELFKEIARRTHLKYTIRRSADGTFGSPIDGTRNREWSGMVGELIRGSAQVGVASLTITYDREKVVDFTTPYMSLGLSVIMKKLHQNPQLFQFLLPLSGRVWLYGLLALLLTASVMFACARFSPYEWRQQTGCDSTVRNQFGLHNSIWFTIGSLMQQDSNLVPRASSGRVVATVWCFFTLILTSSYTANLAASLTVTRMNVISSIEDLASQTSVKYGTLLGGSTFNFFKNAEIGLYKTMWQSMSSWSNTNQSFMRKTADGIDRVRQGSYAYILESTFNTYYRERDCSLTQVGGIFSPMSYAFAVKQGNEALRNMLTEEILRLQKEQYIEQLTEEWLKRYNVSKPCSELTSNKTDTGVLGVDEVGGVFVALLLGLSIAIGVCLIELLVCSLQLACSQNIRFSEAVIGQVRLAASGAKTAAASGHRSQQQALAAAAVVELQTRRQLSFSDDQPELRCDP